MNARRFLSIGLATFVVVCLAGFGAIIAFDAPAPLPRLVAGDTLPEAARWNWSSLPTVRYVAARDGAPLSYRLYHGRHNRAVVLVHGSSGANLTMHRIAEALQSTGATVYSISLRGHGGSGTINGDTSYVNQLDDDLVDFAKSVGLDIGKVHRTLMGFSLGGGFVLRTASGPNRHAFDSYVAISPMIAHDAPTARSAAGGWASVAMRRLAALSLLQSIGLPWFQDLPVIRYATDARPDETRTPVYSYRLLMGMLLHRNWREEIGQIDKPTVLIVGADDEIFKAAEYEPLFSTLNPRIEVHVLPDLGHMDMIGNEAAVASIVSIWQRLPTSSVTR